MRMPEGGRRRRLASLNWLGDIDQLRTRAEEALRQTAGSRGEGERLEGADESGSLSVTVDARSRVIDVQVNRQWRDRLEVGAFAGAVFEAYTAAVKASFEAAALAALDAEPSVPEGSAPAVPTGIEESDWLREVWAVLDANDAASRRLSALESPDQRERTLASPGGYLTLHLRGHGLVRITGDVRRIAVADAAQLRHDALVTLRALAPDRARSTDFGSADAT
jgi:hypothetical protein